MLAFSSSFDHCRTYEIPLLLLSLLVNIYHPLATSDVRRERLANGTVGRERGADGFAFELNESVQLRNSAMIWMHHTRCWSTYQVFSIVPTVQYTIMLQERAIPMNTVFLWLIRELGSSVLHMIRGLTVTTAIALSKASDNTVALFVYSAIDTEFCMTFMVYEVSR